MGTNIVIREDNEDDYQPYPLNHSGGREVGQGYPTKSSSIVDTIEFCCHQILIEETSVDKLCEHYNQLGHYISLLEDDEECIYSQGRLHSRLNLVALIYDVFSITCRHRHKQHQETAKVEGKEDQEMGSSQSILLDDNKSDGNNKKESKRDIFFSLHWKYEDWKRVEEQLVLAKSIMSCGNANQFILPSRVSKKNLDGETEYGGTDFVLNAKPPATVLDGSSSVPTSAFASDTVIQGEKNMDAFEKDYQEVLRLLQVEAEIAKFYQRLLVLKLKQREGTGTTQKINKTGSLFLKHLESALNDYASGLNKIFHDNAFAMNDDGENENDNDSKVTSVDEGKNDDIDNKDVDEEQDGRDNMESSDGVDSRVSTYLISALLPELYQKNTESLLDRLLEYLRKQILHNPQNEFSYEQIQSKYRAIIIRWSNMVLETPLLVQKSEYIETNEETAKEEGDRCLDVDDDDDVSSWGEDDGKLLRSFDESEDVKKKEVTLVGTEIDISVTVTSRRKKSDAETSVEHEHESYDEGNDISPHRESEIWMFSCPEAVAQKRKREISDPMEGVEYIRPDGIPTKKARAT